MRTAAPRTTPEQVVRTYLAISGLFTLAASVIWAVDLPDDGPTGGFFRDGAPLQW